KHLRELVRAAREHEDGVDGCLVLRVERLLRDGDHDDPRTRRRGAYALCDVYRRHLALQQRIDHDDVGLLGRDLCDRGVGLALNARNFDFLLAGQYRLKVRSDLWQVCDEKNAFHSVASLVERARQSPAEAMTATTAATAMNDRPMRNVMPCQYQSGYSRTRLLVAGSKRKLPCGKKTSWKKRKACWNASAAIRQRAKATTPAATAPSRTRRSIAPALCARARCRRM